MPIIVPGLHIPFPLWTSLEMRVEDRSPWWEQQINKSLSLWERVGWSNSRRNFDPHPALRASLSQWERDPAVRFCPAICYNEKVLTGEFNHEIFLGYCEP